MSGTPWERYMHPELTQIWYTPEGVGQFEFVHRVSIAAAQAQEKHLPGFKVGTAAALKRVTVDLERILQIQSEGENHQLRCYLKMVQERMEASGDSEFLPWVHYQLTSFDLQDTATNLMLAKSAQILESDSHALASVLQALAIQHKKTLMIGRTHGIHGKPITFGKKCLDWLEVTLRNAERLYDSQKEIRLGKISGAMGIYTQDPQIEVEVCALLGLRPARVSTQIISRDIYADFFHNLVLVVGGLEIISTAIRLGQQTERRELEEPFGSTGSSAMPHKRNPEKAEQIKGLAKVVRASMAALYENMDTWDERSLEQSSTERVLFSTMIVLTGYAIKIMTVVLSGLTVNQERMLANIGLTNGAIYAEDLKTALQEAGIPQTEAYELAKVVAQKAYYGQGDLVTNALADPQIAKVVSREQLEALCDPRSALRYIDQIYARFGIREEKHEPDTTTADSD